MDVSAPGRTWEEASSPAAVRLARQFEAAWRDSRGRRRPEPDDFLPDDGPDRPGARLALLRADLTLRWEAGERVGADWYRDRYPDLDAEALVALVYEEFCLREEEQGTPDPDEYLARYPQVASQLRRVLDIHGLVGSGAGQTTASMGSCPGAPSIAFPEAGQTIAGFHLVEELGRGAFARVFLARERQLADRPVALKVARAGSREPQTLARLQHTHIVPVHSSRTDPATGLHLLCMPYFGRITLARVLADPAVKDARTGADLVEVLDRLGPPKGPPAGRTSGRAALARRTYARAIAWWGARMAEALEHAHERGVLHRDIKPTNVLVTADGMPMLLDFNLARELVPDDPEAVPGTLGGTLDYMAPEHLDALAEGHGESVDGRADLYGLGVLLHEALVGVRPFPPPRGARSAPELLLRAAEERRAGAPWLRDEHPEVPAALEAVVRRCLAPDPADRYASAGELAADLQAVADDRPLRFTREPMPARSGRWLRHHRRHLAMAAPVIVALAVVGFSIKKDLAEKDKVREEFQSRYLDGRRYFEAGDFGRAMELLSSAESLADQLPELGRLKKGLSAHELLILARQKRDARDAADALFVAADPLRFHLIGIGADLASATDEITRALKDFFVFSNREWARSPETTVMLDAPRRARLVDTVNELLFLWAVALDHGGERNEALTVCDRALAFATPKGPWLALRARLLSAPGMPTGTDGRDDPSAETSALACSQWGLLRELERRRGSAIEWLKRAVALKPDDYWHEYLLAFTQDRGRLPDEALRHYTSAVALRPESPWVRYSLARLYRGRYAWQQAKDDLNLALKTFHAEHRPEEWRTRLELGLVYQSLGDQADARAQYERVIAADPKGDYARAARVNRAKLDVDAGAADRAMAEYNALLAEHPTDASARLGRALLALRQGRAVPAEADLTALLARPEVPDPEDPANRAEVLAQRALARLILGRAAEAERDASEAFRLAPGPARERLRSRTLVALGRVDQVRLDNPDELARWPANGPALASDLRKAADRLRDEAAGKGAAALRAALDRAVLLAALGDPDAEAEADRAVALARLSPQPYLIRARVRRYRGAIAGALADVDRGLEVAPTDPRLWELRGLLESDSGDPRAAIADFERAIQGKVGATIHAPMAMALFTIGRADLAVRAWTDALSHDPEDPEAYLGRARAFFRLGKRDQARADLEQAADWAVGHPGLGVRIVMAAARGLAGNPDQVPRAMALARRVFPPNSR